MASSDPSNSTGPRSNLGERLRTYLIGVGVGAMLLGLFWMMKYQTALQQAQQQNTTPNGASSTPAPQPNGN